MKKRKKKKKDQEPEIENEVEGWEGRDSLSSGTDTLSLNIGLQISTDP